MNNNFSILVNTTDSFEDCWEPFFKLFSIFWPSYEGKINLNTESKVFNYNGLNIHSIRNQMNKGTWSECLYSALKHIESNIILYLQDDYFINNNVNYVLINQLSYLLIKNKIGCIQLTPFASTGPFKKSNYYGLLKYDKKSSYKISTQASLWNKELLLKYIRKHENAWQFEIYGTKRAWRNKEEIYIYNFEDKNEPIIPYTPTGIIKGKWNKNAVFDLFIKNGINIDYSKRGFYSGNESSKRKIPSLNKIISRLKSF